MEANTPVEQNPKWSSTIYQSEFVEAMKLIEAGAVEAIDHAKERMAYIGRYAPYKKHIQEIKKIDDTVEHLRKVLSGKRTRGDQPGQFPLVDECIDNLAEIEKKRFGGGDGDADNE